MGDKPTRGKNAMTRRGMAALTALALVASLSGCELIAKLRHALKGDDGGATLRVEVQPPVGINILLDGKKVANRSPYVSKQLNPGPHVLEVRAHGYYPVTLPVEVLAGETLNVPVALRPAAAKEAPLAKEKPPAPPPPPAPPLPPGVHPVSLLFATSPDSPMLLDGNPVAGKKLTIERVFGKIAAGPIALSYRLGGAGLLEFTLPEEKATWTKDGTILLAGNSFRLHQGATRITRMAADGTYHTLILKR